MSKDLDSQKRNSTKDEKKRQREEQALISLIPKRKVNDLTGVAEMKRGFSLSQHWADGNLLKLTFSSCHGVNCESSPGDVSDKVGTKVTALYRRSNEKTEYAITLVQLLYIVEIFCLRKNGLNDTSKNIIIHFWHWKQIENR